MNVRIFARTTTIETGEIPMIPNEFAGIAAGVCYMGDSFNKLLEQDFEKHVKRAHTAASSGHHSVFGHDHITLLFEGIPKIVAMVLNNAGAYNTSEKSARYTVMTEIDPEEKKLYDKWVDILKEKILEKYPEMTEKHATKLAQENARYMISVFTPTTMVYTTNMRDLQYTIHRAKKFIETEQTTPFYIRLKDCMIDFVDEISKVIDIDENLKPLANPDFNIFDKLEDDWIDINNYFATSYTVKYEGTFAQFAQAQRHRTLDYKMYFAGDAPKHTYEFYVPHIIFNDSQYYCEWITDIKSVAHNFPQGTFIKIVECGTLDNFLLKAHERECACAQLEIQKQTAETHYKYVISKNLTKAEKEKLSGYAEMLRCRYDKPFKCKTPCIYKGDEKKFRLV